MNRSTIQNSNHNHSNNNNDSKGINDATTTLLPLPPTPPTTSELSPLDSRESQGQGLGLVSGLMQPNGLIRDDDEITTTRDPPLAINGSNGELSVEDRCVRVSCISYQHSLARHLTFVAYPNIIFPQPILHSPYSSIFSPCHLNVFFFIPTRTAVCREGYRNINIGTASR